MTAAKKGPRLARAAGLISAATMLSRVLGLAREQLFAALVGATMYADAFNVAFRIPNLLRDLFAEGALAQAFVPTFKRDLERGGASDAYDLANKVASTLFVVIGVIVLVAGIFAYEVVSVLADDYDDVPGKLELTVLLTRVMLPFLPVISLAAVAMGMLNAQDRYGRPALAPATFNCMSIAVGLGLYFGGAQREWVVIGWAIGTVAGGLCQLGIQLPPLWRLGYRPRPKPDLRMRDRRVRHIGRLMLPAIGGLAAVQINIIVNTIFATQTDGAVSWLNYAFRFLQLPIGVFGVAIATVSTTRYANAAAHGDRASMAEHLVEGLRLVMFLTVPATVGLVLLGEPIIALIFERGRFYHFDTLATAEALRFYAIGLVSYSAVKVLAPAFYAVDRARVAMIASMSAVAANLILNVTLHPIYGYSILALGTSAAAIMNAAVLYVVFSRIVSRLDHRQILLHLLRVVAAAALMGAAVWGSHRWLAATLGTDGLGARAVVALVPVTVGAIVYAAGCAALRVDELDQYTSRLRRLVRR